MPISAYLRASVAFCRQPVRTNGNTILHPVKAHFLHTDLIANGGVVKTPELNGRTVVLDVNIKNGRLEDLMRLAVKADQPPLTGKLELQTKFELPPGKRDISDKLKLKGKFSVLEGAFTNPEVSAKIAGLSRRALGKPGEETAGSAISSLSGNFVLNNGLAQFSKLTFSVAGASIELAGTYGLEKETLDFHGRLVMQAKLSQTTTGVKSLLLKPVDPFFRKNGQTELPIKVTGTRDHPQFGLELHRKQKKEEGE
jgi:AsmA-like C-terminal region